MNWIKSLSKPKTPSKKPQEEPVEEEPQEEIPTFEEVGKEKFKIEMEALCKTDSVSFYNKYIVPIQPKPEQSISGDINILFFERSCRLSEVLLYSSNCLFKLTFDFLEDKKLSKNHNSHGNHCYCFRDPSIVCRNSNH